MSNHTTARLWEKFLEFYEGYATEEQGGQLVFIIMIKKLVSYTESAVTFLQGTIEKIITDYEGEKYATSKLLTSFWKQLIRSLRKVFQTSSVPEFNGLFFSSSAKC